MPKWAVTLYFLSTKMYFCFVLITIKKNKIIFIFMYVLRFFSSNSNCPLSGICCFIYQVKMKKERTETHIKTKIFLEGCEIAHLISKISSIFFSPSQHHIRILHVVPLIGKAQVWLGKRGLCGCQGDPKDQLLRIRFCKWKFLSKTQWQERKFANSPRAKLV